MMGSLTFAEVVDRVLDKNWCREESSLAELHGCHTRIRGELDDLIEARWGESNEFTQKRIKREIDLRRKDIENLRVAISHHETNLGRGQPGDIATHDDDSSDHGAREAAEAEMAIAPETDDTPSGSATTHSSDPPPAEGQAHAMEVDDEDVDPSPASPVSSVDDDLLTGGGVVGVEGDMANLTVSSPKNPDGGAKMPLFRRLLLTSSAVFLQGTPSECLQDASGKGMKPLWWTEEEGCGTPGGTSQMIEGAD